MKVFYDSNVVLDVLLNRTDFLTDSFAALKFSETRKVKGYISVVSTTDIFYLVNRNLKDTQQSIEKMRVLFSIVDIAKADKKIALNALNSGWKDFEDAVQYSVAKKLGTKYIITRNQKDYLKSDIQVVSPKEFTELMQSNR